MRETLATKKYLIIIAAVGLALIGALLVYGIMVTPARQPYRDALTQYENTNNALSRTSVSVNSGTASDEEFAKNIEAVQKTLVSLETENDALAKEAVLKDGEGKRLYDAYNEDIKAYVAYNRDVLTSMAKVRPVLYKCTAESSETVSAEDAKTMQDCADAMNAAKDVPDADYKEYAEAVAKNYAARAALFAQMAAATDRQSDAYGELVTQYSQTIESFSEASTAFAKNVQQTRKQILNTSSARDLKAYLEDESRIF